MDLWDELFAELFKALDEVADPGSLTVEGLSRSIDALVAGLAILRARREELALESASTKAVA